MTQNDISISEPVKHLLDAVSIGAAVATFFSLLPDIAALLSVVWLVIRIYESETVQKIVRRFRRG